MTTTTTTPPRTVRVHGPVADHRGFVADGPESHVVVVAPPSHVPPAVAPAMRRSVVDGDVAVVVTRHPPLGARIVAAAGRVAAARGDDLDDVLAVLRWTDARTWTAAWVPDARSVPGLRTGTALLRDRRGSVVTTTPWRATRVPRRWDGVAWPTTAGPSRSLVAARSADDPVARLIVAGAPRPRLVALPTDSTTWWGSDRLVEVALHPERVPSPLVARTPARPPQAPARVPQVPASRPGVASAHRVTQAAAPRPGYRPGQRPAPGVGQAARAHGRDEGHAAAANNGGKGQAAAAQGRDEGHAAAAEGRGLGRAAATNGRGVWSDTEPARQVEDPGAWS